MKGGKGVHAFSWAPPETITRMNQERITQLYREAVQGLFAANAHALASRIAPHVLARTLEMPVEELRREHIVQVADLVPDF